ncbi:MAG: hypothetical protein EHM18_05455 [Acidobacteria bacterium]|nr:MAG: hypothetical protein EHM18_05455 [Acidobacteriota bacterium]
MSRKLILPLLLLCFSLPVLGQNLGDQSSAGFTNARTYANLDLGGLRPPLRLFETIDLPGIFNATSLAVFENQFLVGQPGSPITYKLFNRQGAEVWTQTLVGSGANFRFVPAISNSIVILGGDSTASIRAVSVIDGSELWRDNAGDTNGRFPAVTDNLAIYAGSGQVVARTLAGASFWQLPVTTAAAALAVRDDSLYFLAKDRTLWAINLATQTQKWAPIAGAASDGASLIATEKYIFINDPSIGAIGAINAATGALEWNQQNLAGTFATAPALALGYGRLYVFRSDNGDGDAAVAAYDANTGAEVWSITEPGAGLSSAFIADNTVYYYHAGEQIRARDAATGALLWSFAKSDVRALSAANGELYVLLDDEIEVYVHLNEIFMAQLANGGGQTTVLMLANPNPRPVDATVNFYDEEGAPVPVPLRTHGTKSEVEVTVPANSSLSIETLGQTQVVTVGWVHVVSDEPLRGTTNFQFTEGGEIVREAGVADSLPIGSANVFISVGGGFNAGVAIANPTEQDADLTLRLLDDEGEELANRSFSLPSGAHMAQFVNELFEDEVGTAFEGTLVIDSNVPVVATAIRTKDGVQISSYPVGQAVR